MPCCRLLQRLIFVDGVVIDEDTSPACPRGLASTRQRFIGISPRPSRGAGTTALLDEARTRGAFGVPTFFLGKRMFWGNDRLVLLEAALRGATRSGTLPAS